MEEDTGKSQHLSLNGEDVTLLDFNRSGVPLVEIVSEPDIHSSQTSKDYLNKLQQIIRYLGVSDADIEKGSMRCEPTINVQIETDDGQTAYTPLAEIKNVASLTGVMNAIDFEVDRQVRDWQENGTIKTPNNKTTRGWDADHNRTFLQREKEGSADYRYFPEPDIPPIEWLDDDITAIKSTIGELPDQKIAKYKNTFGLSDYDASVLADNPAFADAYEKALGQSPSPELAKFVANLFLGPLKTYFNETSAEVDQNKINPVFFAQLFQSVQSSELSSTVAKQVIVESYESDKNPVSIAKDKGLIQVSDIGKIESLAKQVIEANPKAVADYQKNPMSIGFLIGQLMKASGGSANPKLAKEILEKLLTS
jgi:aspartyl-tRNA(Asn)/glutamyl-tRNA(Gln) amidotransferase subunit B